jgi:FMN phosphatase YigB (HAD superfamily)
MQVDWDRVQCVVFDYGFTLSSELYFNVAPAGYPGWRDTIQRLVFDERAVAEAWMRGQLTLVDIAAIVGREIPLPVETIIETMEQGCRKLRFNPAVWEFAQAQRGQGRKTALVTGNFDVFTNVIVPAHGLAAVFDMIVNSSDHGTWDKRKLWPIAFERLGQGISYKNSLLIEDGEKEPAQFRALGGQAYQYAGEEGFQMWLRANRWSCGSGLA